LSVEATKVKLRARNNIAKLLQKTGSSKAWLAREISYGLEKPVPSQMVSDWCSNRTQPSIAYIMRILKITGWSLEEMFEEVEE
jgi:hypothetical protein